MEVTSTDKVRVLHTEQTRPAQRRISPPRLLRLRDRFLAGVGPAHLDIIAQIERARPDSLRDYDQIPMRSQDLIRQVRLVAPYLANQSIAFVGDHDCTSLVLSLLCAEIGIPLPRRMLILDFDERLLESVYEFATRHGFSDIIDILINVKTISGTATIISPGSCLNS